MLDYIDDEYITLNFAGKKLASNKWFFNIFYEIANYYDTGNPGLFFHSIRDEKIRNYVLEFFRKQGLEVEFFDFDSHASVSTEQQYGFVFKNTESLTHVILKYSDRKNEYQ